MNLDIQEKDESKDWFDADELHFAQPEIFEMIEDGDIEGLNQYLTRQFFQQGGF